MAERKDDEIMAEYLLKGGKMLEKTCPSCGCPLFEYKKKTFCVVCAEKKPADRGTGTACFPDRCILSRGSDCTGSMCTPKNPCTLTSPFSRGGDAFP